MGSGAELEEKKTQDPGSKERNPGHPPHDFCFRCNFLGHSGCSSIFELSTRPIFLFTSF